MTVSKPEELIATGVSWASGTLQATVTVNCLIENLLPVEKWYSTKTNTKNYCEFTPCFNGGLPQRPHPIYTESIAILETEFGPWILEISNSYIRNKLAEGSPGQTEAMHFSKLKLESPNRITEPCEVSSNFSFCEFRDVQQANKYDLLSKWRDTLLQPGWGHTIEQSLLFHKGDHEKLISWSNRRSFNCIHNTSDASPTRGYKWDLHEAAKRFFLSQRRIRWWNLWHIPLHKCVFTAYDSWVGVEEKNPNRTSDLRSMRKCSLRVALRRTDTFYRLDGRLASIHVMRTHNLK